MCSHFNRFIISRRHAAGRITTHCLSPHPRPVWCRAIPCPALRCVIHCRFSRPWSSSRYYRPAFGVLRVIHSLKSRSALSRYQLHKLVRLRDQETCLPRKSSNDGRAIPSQSTDQSSRVTVPLALLLGWPLALHCLYVRLVVRTGHTHYVCASAYESQGGHRLRYPIEGHPTGPSPASVAVHSRH